MGRCLILDLEMYHFMCFGEYFKTDGAPYGARGLFYARNQLRILRNLENAPLNQVNRFFCLIQGSVFKIFQIRAIDFSKTLPPYSGK